MFRTLVCLTMWMTAAGALGEPNPVANPGFEGDADADGVPERWRTSGDAKRVTQTLSLAPGRDGGRSARLDCSRFDGRGPAGHAMLCQIGVPVRRGAHYRLTFWARGREIAADIVSVALSDTSVWTSCGLGDAFVPAPDWKRHEFIFRATRDCSDASRLQIWFTSTGTLWVDDVLLEEVGPEVFRPGQVVADVGSRNLVRQSSFECGTDAWGSAEWDRLTHWGGRMNRLFGERDAGEAFHGRSSLRIELTPQNQPFSFFDWYELHRLAIRAPLAASIGFIEVEPGQKHTLSVRLKAAQPDTPALLAVRQFHARSLDKPVRVSTEWQRYSLTFTPSARWCYVLAGPDLRTTGENPDPPETATLWLDAVQLEAGDEPTGYEPRRPIELGLWTGKPGNVFGWDEPVRFRMAVSSARDAGDRRAELVLRMTDFFGREVWRDRRDVPADGAVPVELAPDARRRGFLRFEAKATAGGVSVERALRLAVIPIHDAAGSRFGVNHAYPWPHLLDLCRMAGLQWVRDWSLKWQEVEPQKGRFTFTETDYQIDRPLDHGLEVLAMAPFPSSNWSSEAPSSVVATDRYPLNRLRVAYAPRDVGEFENYVRRTVSHYSDRVCWWQVFNEPLYTSYSLPRRHGYDGGDYARLVEAFAGAARQADPDCRILAGIGGLNDGQALEDFEQFFAAGGLAAVDAVDIHHYPRIRPPEFFEGLMEKLNALMDAHGGRKPIWLTEYGYYADDDPSSVPMGYSTFNRPLESESLQAAYAVRWATIVLAGGAEKIFYHAGTCDAVNDDSLQGIFFEYAGQPHKIYAAQAVMSHLLTPTSTFVKRLALGEGVRAYLFRDGRRPFAVVWATAGAEPRPLELTDEKMQLWDIMGRPQPDRQFKPTGTPVYVLADGLTDEVFERRFLELSSP